MFAYWYIILIAFLTYIIFALVAVRGVSTSSEYLERLKRKFPFPVDNIAHRGGALIGPENTIFTFQKGLSEGHANMLELDVHESKDGYAVVSHDKNLFRTCGSLYDNLNIDEIEVGNGKKERLPQLLRKIPLHFSTQRHKYYEADKSVPIDNTTRVCLLSDVFEAFPGVPLHIDIKTGSVEFVKSVFKMVEKYGRKHITIIGSSSLKLEKEIYRFHLSKVSTSVREGGIQEKNSKFYVFAGKRRYIYVYLCYYLGILPLISLDFDVFSIPIFTTSRKKELEPLAGKFLISVVTFFLRTPTLWRFLQRRGILVNGWVLSDEEQFKEASKLPLNGLMTDDPIALNKFYQTYDVKKTMHLLS